jgi:hypothetical protein
MTRPILLAAVVLALAGLVAMSRDYLDWRAARETWRR